MSVRSTLKDCHDDAGIFIPSKYVHFKRQRDEYFQGAEVLLEEMSKKRPYAARISRVYDPQKSIESLWYKRYVGEPEHH